MTNSISLTIIPFIVAAKTSKEAWNILSNTYAKPSRGCIKQAKTQFKILTKGSQNVTEFLQMVKSQADELALLGAPVDIEDLTDKILDGLDSEYNELVRVVQARDTPISFEELHEKLLNFEASLQVSKPEKNYFPATANPINRYRCPPFNIGHNKPGWRSPNPSSQTANVNQNFPRGDRPPLRPYLGHCQICRIQGHTAKRCPSFRLVPTQSSNNFTPQMNHTISPWQPQAQYASTPTSTPSWLLDSGASHHVTSDLGNLSLHEQYTGADDIMIGDGTSLPITHTGPLHRGKTHDRPN